MVSAANTTPQSAEQRLLDLGLVLPPPPQPLGAYVSALQTGGLLFLSGMLPIVAGVPKFVGRVGAELDVVEGRAAAHTAALNAVATAKAHLGSLDRVVRVVRLAVLITTTEDFVNHPRVADAASQLLESVFGKEKTSTRLVTGVASLPLGLPVELEVIFEIES